MTATAVAAVSHALAQRALAACDLIVSTSDHPGPRLHTACVAAAFARPLLDVGTRILAPGAAPAGGVTMGLDVRLIFPGRCLLCFGGVGPDEYAARPLIASPDAEQRFRLHRDGLAERPGSLDSLNHLAAAFALRCLEESLAGRLTGDTWHREEFLPGGQPRGSSPAPPRGTGPCFCRCAGWGMAAAPHLLAILDERAALAAQASPPL